MRDLTEEELKLKPDWATHYIVDSDESIIYESKKLCWWEGLRDPLNNEGSFGNLSNRTIKHFDITKYEFSDSRITFDCVDGEGDINIYYQEVHDFYINKADAIAIAKALGVTGEDLK